ncbi:protein of unknown function [Pseudomonas sp. JV241A]|nr:protein of unknown function [Pseudomonas sp. JV241A]
MHADPMWERACPAILTLKIVCHADMTLSRDKPAPTV